MKKIFIVGNSRSGTTMLGRVLGSHSAIHTFDELHFFEHQVDSLTVRTRPVWPRELRLQLAERLLTSERDFRHFFASVTKGEYADDAATIVDSAKHEDPISAYESFLEFETNRNKKITPCEQTPRYLFYVQEILDVFPDAVFINLIRDPRDVLLSQKNKWRRRSIDNNRTPFFEALRSWANYHPYIITRLWISSIRTAQRYTADNRFISIKFEDLLANPEANIRQICSKVGIEFEPQMLQVSQIGSSTEIDKPDVKGIDKTRVGGWQRGGLTQLELAVCQKIAKAEMFTLGYAVIDTATLPGQFIWSYITLIFKVALALLLNLSRTKNLLETLRKRTGR